jgi:hypothetical protein
VLDVDVDEAEVIVFEGALALCGPLRHRLGAAVQPFGLEDTPDAVAVEVRQEVAHDKGQVIEGEVSGPAQGADHGAFLFGGLPGQRVGLGGMIEAVCDTAFAPFTDGFGADAIPLGEDA